MSAQIGVIGFAVMGENLALNLADHGVEVAVYNRTAERTRQFIGGAAAGRSVQPTYSLAELVAHLERPRRPGITSRWCITASSTGTCNSFARRTSC